MSFSETTSRSSSLAKHRRGAVLDMKTLVIGVHAAEHLLAKDLNGLSDPYARVTIDDVVVGKTQTKKGDLNPMWKEDFIVPLDDASNMEHSSYEIKIEIFNEYKFGKLSSQIKNVGKQSFLGQITVPLADVLKQGFPQTRQKFLLQKRSTKSHVRGSLYCSFVVDQQRAAQERERKESESMDDGVAAGAATVHDRGGNTKFASTKEGDAESLASGPVSGTVAAGSARVVGAHRRVPSCSSMPQLADWSSQNSIHTLKVGLYSLHLTLVKATDLPEVSSSKTVSVQFTVSVGSQESHSNEYCLNDQKDGVLHLGDTTKVVPVTIRDMGSLPTVRMSMEIQTGLFVRNVLGYAGIKLDNLPILDDNHDLVNALKPFEVFIERRKIHGVVPGNIKFSDTGSMARLRLRAWLSLEAEGEDVVGEGEEEGEEEEVEPEPGLGETPDKLPEPFTWVLCSGTLPFSVHKLRYLCFDSESPILKKMAQKQGWADFEYGEWKEGTRDVKYTLPKTTFMKESPAFESQTYEVKSKGAFVVHTTTKIPNAPSGKDFSTHTQFVLTEESPTTSTLQVSSEARFERNIMLKSLISKATKSNMTASYAFFMQTMQNYRGRSASKKENDESAPRRNSTGETKMTEGANTPPRWVWVCLALLACLAVLLLLTLVQAQGDIRGLQDEVGRLEGILAEHAVGGTRSPASACEPCPSR